MGTQTRPHPRAEQPPDLARLRVLWRRWTAAVAQVARGGKRPPMSPAQYHALHAELLTICQSSASADDTLRPILQQVGSLARPWVSLEVLTHTDEKLLRDLLDQCRQTERLLDGAWRGWFRWGVWTIGVASVLAAAAMFSSHSVRGNLLADGRNAVYRAIYHAQQASAEQTLAVLTVLMLAGGAWMLFSPRDY